jgi:acetyl-CoA carboxylase carboxyl transferase subunit beta
MKLFSRHEPSLGRRTKRDIPAGLWKKCEGCGQLLYQKALEEHLHVCPKCEFHFPLTARARIALTLDEGTFEEWDAELRSLDPLEFKVPEPYPKKLEETQRA